MVISKVFFVSVTALLAACGTCFQDAAALHRIDEGSYGGRGLLGRKKNGQEVLLADGGLDTGDVALERTPLSVEGTSSTRDLLRRRGKKGKNKRRGGNSNNGGVFISQPTNPNIQGDGNTVVGGSVGNVFNPNTGTGRNPRNPRRPRNQGNSNNGGVFINQPTNPNITGNSNQVIGGAVGDVNNGRKLKSIEGTSASRGLLRRNFNQEARDRIFNSNNGGVFISQPTNPNIQGDNNRVVGGGVGNIQNPGTGGSTSPPSPGTGGSVWTPPPPPPPTPTPPPATNSNSGGVFISQPTNPTITGNGNQVVGGSVGNIGGKRKLSSIEGISSTRDLLRRRGKKGKRGRRGGNSNNGGVFISQPTNPNIRGNSNQVVGGSVGNIFNTNTGSGRNPANPRNQGRRGGNSNNGGVFINQPTNPNIQGDGNVVRGGYVGDINNGRKLKSIEGTSATRGLLRRNFNQEARDRIFNSNTGGVFISQPTNPNIQGDNNRVVGGSVGNIQNPGTGGGSAPPLPPPPPPPPTPTPTPTPPPATNSNTGGVFISQPTNPTITGNGNQVVGGGVGDIFNGRKLESIEGASASRGLLRRNFNQEARDRIFNSNNGGVFVSQPTNPNIRGNGNQVVGGSVGNIGNSGTGGNTSPTSPGTGGSVWTPPPPPTAPPPPPPPPATNSNTGGVFISQPTNPDVQGDGNTIIGGSVGDINNGRKLKSIEGTSVTRGLLGSEKKADSQAVNVNKDGVLISTQTTANIEGDNNKVIGDTGPIKVDSDDDAVVVKGKAISIVEDTPDDEKPEGEDDLTATSSAANFNDGGVLISQQTTANIKGDGNVVKGGVTGDIFSDK